MVANAFALPAWAQSTVQAQDDSAALETIHVTADRQGSKTKTDVVRLKEKDESTATDMRALLQDEPAIDFGGGTGAAQFLTIRGMGQNSVDIKIDNAYSDSQVLYHQGRFILDPALVKIVSVQKGAGSASAGIGQTNGSIIAKTVDAADLLKGLDKDWGVKVNAGYASNRNHSYGATVFGRAGLFDGLVSYNRVDEGDYKPGKGYANDINGGKTIPYSALDKRNYLVKLGANFGNHRLVVSRMQDQQRGERTIREEFTTTSSLPLTRQAPVYRETTLVNNNIEWTAKDWGFIETLNANAYLMQNTRYSADDRACGYCGNIPGPTTTKITTKGANVNLDSRIGDTLLKYGVNYRHQEIQPHAFLNTYYRLSNPHKADTGAYVEAIHNIGDFTLTGGLRYDHFKFKAVDGKTASGSKLNPSLGMIWQPTDTLNFSVVHNYASRSPRLYDALLTHSINRITLPINNRGVVSIAEGTKAERARNTEIGFNYNNGKFSANGSYFWQHIKDALANPQNRHGDNTQANYLRNITNAGYIKNRGYELGAAWRDGGLTARIGVSHAKPRIYDTHPDNLLSANPEFAVPVGRTWTAGLSYRFNQPNLEVGVRNRTVQKSAGTVLVRNEATSTDVRKTHNVTDVFLNWKPLNNDNLNVNFAVNNLFNRFYYPHSQRATITTWPGAGRDVRLGVNYRF
nr:TonB-dependent siderophore receptor [Neisseria sp. HSC-16F19]